MSKKRGLLYILVLISVYFVGAMYYFQIMQRITPDQETLLPFMMNYLQYKSSNIIMATANIFTERFGCNYLAVRLWQTMFYSFTNLITFDIAIRSNKKEIHWSMIPVYVLFMIMMHLGVSGGYSYEDFQIHQYGFNTHMPATLFVMFSIWLLYRFWNKNKWIKIVFIPVFYFLYKYSDLLYIITFVLPLLFVLVLYSCKREKRRVPIYISGALGFILIIKIVSRFVNPLKQLFTYSAVSYDSSYIYGVADFIKSFQIWNNIAIYLNCTSGLFNLDVWGNSCLNLAYVGYIIKLIMLFIGVVCILRRIGGTFLLKLDEDIVQDTMSYGVLFLSAFYILTTQGYNQNPRYLSILLPYTTVIICWNLYDILGKKNRFAFTRQSVAIITALTILVTVNIDYFTTSQRDGWDEAYDEVNRIIDEEGLHDGLANFWNCNNIMVLSDMQHYIMAADVEGDAKFVESSICGIFMKDKKDCYFDYVIFSNPDCWSRDWGMSISKIQELFGTPSGIYHCGYLTVVAYKDGRLMIPMGLEYTPIKD